MHPPRGNQWPLNMQLPSLPSLQPSGFSSTRGGGPPPAPASSLTLLDAFLAQKRRTAVRLKGCLGNWPCNFWGSVQTNTGVLLQHDWESQGGRVRRQGTPAGRSPRGLTVAGPRRRPGGCSGGDTLTRDNDVKAERAPLLRPLTDRVKGRNGRVR